MQRWTSQWRLAMVKKQSMKDRRDEAKAMNKKATGKAYASVKTMDKKKK